MILVLIWQITCHVEHSRGRAGIDKLSKISKVSLAISLHAANDQLRDVLVPINKRYPIKQLLDACRRYAREREGAPITFEYVMLEDINDSAVMPDSSPSC